MKGTVKENTKYGKVVYLGTWHVPFRATNVLCSDGKRRCAFNLKTPDTFFSLPASVKVKGKMVTGYLYTEETNGHNDVLFSAFVYGKNGHLLP